MKATSHGVPLGQAICLPSQLRRGLPQRTFQPNRTENVQWRKLRRPADLHPQCCHHKCTALQFHRLHQQAHDALNVGVGLQAARRLFRTNGPVRELSRVHGPADLLSLQDDTIETYYSNFRIESVTVWITVWKGTTAPTVQLGWASRTLGNLLVADVDIIHLRYLPTTDCRPSSASTHFTPSRTRPTSLPPT